MNRLSATRRRMVAQFLKQPYGSALLKRAHPAFQVIYSRSRSVAHQINQTAFRNLSPHRITRITSLERAYQSPGSVKRKRHMTLSDQECRRRWRLEFKSITLRVLDRQGWSHLKVVVGCQERCSDTPMYGYMHTLLCTRVVDINRYSPGGKLNPSYNPSNLPV